MKQKYYLDSLIDLNIKKNINNKYIKRFEEVLQECILKGFAYIEYIGEKQKVRCCETDKLLFVNI